MIPADRTTNEYPVSVKLLKPQGFFLARLFYIYIINCSFIQMYFGDYILSRIPKHVCNLKKNFGNEMGQFDGFFLCVKDSVWFFFLLFRC